MPAAAHLLCRKIKIFDNQIKLKHLSAPHFTYLEERGVMQWRLNVEAVLSEGLELDRFPFDRQLLTAHINVRTAQVGSVACRLRDCGLPASCFS